ncbi:glycoside hydrolase family 88 protein [Paenibacillus aurantius]|uniref:Glycoside hydrolase family 88 protein n=1 Tax=Paenibacillus aurantius TaxID=2918900 RepID=A0AA96LJG9_9BACL|nr:glycoside hydrolase family 88 protein [Paenibacillus aurantius]WNQ13235.1 glycoside hydrolase family 88 protein [Paenibacillus aurantius]
MSNEHWQDPLLWADQFMERYREDGSEKFTRSWNYEIGCFLRALEECGRQSGDDRYFAYIRNRTDQYVQEDGSIRTYVREHYNLDQIHSGKLLFLLLEQTGEAKYRKAIENLIKQMKGHPRTEEGGFWHKKIYPFQMWLDGLYMAAPFLAQYGKLTGEESWFDTAAEQLVLVEKKTRNPENGLLHHAWDASGEQPWADSVTGRSPHVWSRAMGWYAMALVDTLDHLPEDHPKRGLLIGLMERMAGALVRVQDAETGLWPQVLDQSGREGNYLEASGTSMFAYALAKGARLGYLTGSAGEAARRGYEGLLRYLVREEEGGQVHLTQCNSVAGLGGSPYRDGTFAYYIGERVVEDDPKAVSPFILAGLENGRLHAAKERRG